MATKYINLIQNEPGILGYWRVADSSGATSLTDSGPNGYTAPITGTITLGTTGLLTNDTSTCGAWGASGQAITTATIAVPSTSLSLEAWVRTPSSAPGGFNFPTIAGIGTNSTDHWINFGLTPGGSLYGGFFGDDTAPVANHCDGLVHHVVFVWDRVANLQLLYVDGTQITSRTPSSTPSISPASMIIGDAPGGGSYWTGSIQELVFYGLALTPLQVTQHYQMGKNSYYKGVVLGDTPTSYWRLDESAGTVATDTMGVNNGTYTGAGATLAQTGLISDGSSDTCISLSGAGAGVDVASVLGFSGTASFTYEAWLTFPSNTGTVPFQDIMGWNDFPNPNNRGIYLQAGVSGGNLLLQLTRADGTTAHSALSGYPSPTTNNSLVAGNTYHVVGTYDGFYQRLYINGTRVAQLADSLSVPAQSVHFKIGAASGFNALTASVDEVAVYSAVLTGEQIRTHYQAGTNALPVANSNMWSGAWVAGGFSGSPNPQQTFDNLIAPSTIKVVQNFTLWGGNIPPDNNFYSMARGIKATPLQTWEPWNGVSADPSFTLSTLVTGTWDAYITGFAQSLAAYKYPIILRLAHEMNQTYNAWSTGPGNPNGNTPAQYVTFWQYVWTKFQAAGVTNVLWMWCPNIFSTGGSTYSSNYPGDSYVDFVGFDAYNNGTAISFWGEAFDIYSQSYDLLRSLTTKPIIIGETSTAEAGGSDPTGVTKPLWITRMLTQTLPKSIPNVKGFLWFEENKQGVSGQTNWIVETSSSALSAYQTGLTYPMYQTITPYPEILSVSPSTEPAGSGSTPITITGFGFSPSSTVTWNGSATGISSLSVVNSTTVTCTLASSLLTTQGTANIVVNSNGRASDPFVFTIGMAQGAAQLTSATPNNCVAGSANQTVAVAGSLIQSGGQCLWNAATPLAFVFNSSTSLTVTIPASLVANPGSGTITYVNPAQAASNALTFTIYTPPCTITALNPTSTQVNSNLPSIQITASASAPFAVGCQGQYNGTSRTTHFISSTSITIDLLPSDTNTVGTYNVSVTNPNVATSNIITFSVASVAPAILTSVSPNPGIIGTSGTLQVFGQTGTILNGAVIYLDGSPTTGNTWISSSEIDVPYSIAISATNTTHNVTVVNPSSTASNTIVWTVSFPTPSITSVSPSTLPSGSSTTVVTINGGGFLFGYSGGTTTANWNGHSRTTTLISTTQLQMTILNTDLTSPGSGSIQIVNTGSISSNIFTFIISGKASLVVTIGGVDYSSFVVVSSMNIAQVLTRRGDTAKFTVVDQNKTFLFVPLSRVIISDLAGNIKFAGYATVIRAKIPEFTSIIWEFECQDATYYLEKTLVNKKYSSMTVDQIAIDLLKTFPPSIPITTNNVQSGLPILAYFAADHLKLGDAFDKLVKMSSPVSFLMWDVDYNNDLHFFDQGHVPTADLVLTDAVQNLGASPKQVNMIRDTLYYQRDATQLINTITFRGGTYLSQLYTQKWTAPGGQASFNMDYAPATDTTSGGFIPNITVNGVAQIVALDTSTGFGSNNCLITVDVTGVNAVLQFAVAPPVNAQIVATYKFDLPILVRRSDAGSVNKYSIWEEYIVDTTVATQQAAFQRAGALLSQYAQVVATLDCELSRDYSGSLGAGQLLPVTLAQLGLSQNFIITDCKIVGMAGGRHRYHITGVAFV